MDVIIKSLYPKNHELYAMQEGRLYSVLITDEPIAWSEQEIPTLTQVFEVNTKKTIGRALFCSGSALALGVESIVETKLQLH